MGEEQEEHRTRGSTTKSLNNGRCVHRKKWAQHKGVEGRDLSEEKRRHRAHSHNTSTKYQHETLISPLEYCRVDNRGANNFVGRDCNVDDGAAMAQNFVISGLRI